MEPFELTELQALLEAADYRFATTMRDYPHWYTLRKGWSDQRAFERAVMTIQAKGAARWFMQSRLVYLQLGAYEYWTMGAIPQETILINRSRLWHSHPPISRTE